MNFSFMNIDNQNKKECQPLRNNVGVQPLRGKSKYNTSFTSMSGVKNSQSVSQKDYAELQAKYDVACRIIAAQRLEAQKNQQDSNSLDYLA